MALTISEFEKMNDLWMEFIANPPPKTSITEPPLQSMPSLNENRMMSSTKNSESPCSSTNNQVDDCDMEILLDENLPSVSNQDSQASSSFTTKYVNVNLLNPDFSIRSHSLKRVEEFVGMLKSGAFRVKDTIFKISQSNENPQRYQVFSGSHRLSAIKQFNEQSDEPIQQIQCQVYSNALSYSDRISILTDKQSISDNYFTLNDRIEILRHLFYRKNGQETTKSEQREEILQLHEQTFQGVEYKLGTQAQYVVSDFVFMPKNHWSTVKEVMMKFENGLIMQYSDKPNNSMYKNHEGRPEICVSFYVEFFRAYKMKPQKAIDILKALSGTERSLSWGLEKLKTLGHTLKETLEDLKIFGYKLDDPPNIHEASMFFVGRSMGEFELCESLRSPRALNKLKRRRARPAHLVAANLKDSSSNTSIGLTVTHTAINDLKSLSDCSVILHEFPEFESMLEQISSKTILTFIGKQSYLDQVQLKLGEPHLQVETRIHELRPIADSTQKPANVNSIVGIYLMELQMGQLLPNRELLLQMFCNFQVPLGSFMHLDELANVLQLTQPSELFAINIPENVTEKLSKLALNINSLKTIILASETTNESSEMAIQLQKFIDDNKKTQNEPQVKQEPKAKQKQIIKFNESDIKKNVSKRMSQKQDKTSNEKEKTNEEDLNQNLLDRACPDFYIVCSPMRSSSSPVHLSNESGRTKMSRNDRVKYLKKLQDLNQLQNTSQPTMSNSAKQPTKKKRSPKKRNWFNSNKSRRKSANQAVESSTPSKSIPTSRKRPLNQTKGPDKKRKREDSEIRPFLTPIDVQCNDDDEIQQFCNSCGLISSNLASGVCEICASRSNANQSQSIQDFVAASQSIPQFLLDQSVSGQDMHQEQMDVNQDLSQQFDQNITQQQLQIGSKAYSLCPSCSEFKILHKSGVCRACYKPTPKSDKATPSKTPILTTIVEKSDGQKIIKCADCKLLKKLRAKNRCSTCYNKYRKLSKKHGEDVEEQQSSQQLPPSEKEGLDQSFAAIDNFLSMYENAIVSTKTAPPEQSQQPNPEINTLQKDQLVNASELEAIQVVKIENVPQIDEDQSNLTANELLMKL